MEKLSGSLPLRHIECTIQSAIHSNSNTCRRRRRRKGGLDCCFRNPGGFSLLPERMVTQHQIYTDGTELFILVLIYQSQFIILSNNLTFWDTLLHIHDPTVISILLIGYYWNFAGHLVNSHCQEIILTHEKMSFVFLQEQRRKEIFTHSQVLIIFCYLQLNIYCRDVRVLTVFSYLGRKTAACLFQTMS